MERMCSLLALSTNYTELWIINTTITEEDYHAVSPGYSKWMVVWILTQEILYYMEHRECVKQVREEAWRIRAEREYVDLDKRKALDMPMYSKRYILTVSRIVGILEPFNGKK